MTRISGHIMNSGKLVIVIVLLLAGSIFIAACDDRPAGTSGDRHTLTINHQGEGETTPPEGENYIDPDSMVDISVEAEEGWEFAGWGGQDEEELVKTNGDYQIKMEEDREITAKFELLEREEITMEDDWIIAEGEEEQLKGKRIYLDGDLRLERGAELTLENSLLEISLPYKEKHIIEAGENSELNISASTLKSVDNPEEDNDWLEWHHIGLFAGHESSININDSVVGARLHAGHNSENKVEASKIHFVWEQNSNLAISDSTLGSFVIKSTEFAEEDLYLEGFKTGNEINSRTISGLEENKLKIEDSTMKRGVEVSFSSESQQEVWFKDCDIELLWTRFPPFEGEVKLIDLPAHGHVEKFNLAQNIQGAEFSYNYVIEDSNLDLIKPEPGNNEVILSDAKGMVHAAGKDLRAELINSEISHHYNYISEEIKFKDSTLVGDLQLLSPDSIRTDIEFEQDDIIFNHIFEKSQIRTDRIKIATARGTISGEVAFQGLLMSDVVWEKGEIIREYPLKIVDDDGEGVSRIEISYGENKKITGDEGKAEVEFLFNEYDYHEKREIFIEDQEGREKKIEIDFLTDTPVKIEI